MTTPWVLRGRVRAGQGRAAGFTSLGWVRSGLLDSMGIEPYPGTLNLELQSAGDLWTWAEVRGSPATLLEPPDPAQCAARCYPVWIGRRLPGAVVLPMVPGYPPDRLELIGPVALRQALNLADGDELEVEFAQLPALAAVIFDVDGTLVDSLEGYRLAASRAAGDAAYPVTLDAVRAALNGDGSFWDLVLAGHPDHSPSRVEALRARTMAHWPAVVREHVGLAAGVPETMARLRGAGIRLAIYTGSGGESFLPLQQAGLLETFDVVVTARDVGRPKPHPEGLWRCLERLGEVPHRVAYVGDTAADMQAARAAGLTAVGVLGGAGDSARLAMAGAHWLLPGLWRLPGLLGLPGRPP